MRTKIADEKIVRTYMLRSKQYTWILKNDNCLLHSKNRCCTFVENFDDCCLHEIKKSTIGIKINYNEKKIVCRNGGFRSCRPRRSKRKFEQP